MFTNMPTDRDNAEERFTRVDQLLQKLKTKTDRDRLVSRRAHQAKAQISPKPKKKIR